ncbi:hypothetical protein ENUP19_0170G0020 [Entamoeba nuttalli]|uniref:Uncharacterized protein n=2 Tax=Entamoeba nuttalli TaxID=412467 RepID=K2GYT8_ENTNP|nr:hypothetical protein ENU1_090720 [Entamoeba nuttalli P19]EKE40428.1 hypothetical protein ENU1_090720 [Entamoeba nuttalli P19]|eukprot:XP_008857236.1 hypothetical protein ENU1_090720 [Entamoeba nuttalli P19]
MILDTGDLKLITPSNEDSGLLVFSSETRMFLCKKVIEEILKDPSKFPSNFMSKKQMNRDKFMFTLSVFGACFYDGIRSDTLIKINQAIEIYDEWMTSIPRNKIITTEFLKTMINQLTLPFSFSNESNIPERVGVLLKISHLLNKISSGESKHLYTETKQINQELLIHLLKIHFTILYKIMKSSLVNDYHCISLLSETLFCLLLVCEPSQEVKELYKLFPTLFTYWMSFYEFRKVFIQFILVIQKNYLLHYNTLSIIPITPPLISEYPFGTLFIKEKHLRLLWITLIPCLNVSSLTPINLLEITKAIGDLLDDAITSNTSIIILNKIYGNLFFSLIQQYNDISYQEAINFCVIKTLYLYETYIKDIIQSPTLLAKLMIFIRYCLKSQQLNIVISTLSSFDLLLDAHIPEFILLYKDIVCSMLQLTSFYDLTKDKSILKVVITTLSSLSYYFPLLSEYALIQSNNINIDDIIKTQIIILNETNKVGIFPKGYYEKYLNSISNFISVFARLSPNEITNYLYSFKETITKIVDSLFQNFNPNEFVSLYRIFDSILQILDNTTESQIIIKGFAVIIIKIVQRLIHYSSAQIINCFIDKVIEYSTYNESIGNDLFIYVNEMMKYIADHDIILIKNNLERIMNFYYFCMSHGIKNHYYTHLNELSLLLFVSQKQITLNSHKNYQKINEVGCKEINLEDLSKITLWLEKDRIISSFVNKKNKLIILTRGWNGTETYSVKIINKQPQKTQCVIQKKCIILNEKYCEELDGIIDFNKAINESQKINNEQQIHLFFKTERSYKRKCLTEYQGNLINNPISILWKGTIFNDNDKRAVCTLKDLCILQQLQNIKSSLIRNRIYCRVVEKEFNQYIQKNEDLRIEEPILQVIMKKRKNNQWIGKRRRNICEFLYSINTQESTERIKNDVVIFVDDDIPEQTQTEEYVVGIKVIDWNMREIKIKCIDKIEFIGYRNKQEIIGTIEGEIMRLIQRDYPNKMIQQYSDDILQRINITQSNTDQWICNDVIGTYLSKEALNNFRILWNNKNYVSFKDLSQNSIAKEEIKVMNNDDDKIENKNTQTDIKIKRHSIILENTY